MVIQIGFIIGFENDLLLEPMLRSKNTRHDLRKKHWQSQEVCSTGCHLSITFSN